MELNFGNAGPSPTLSLIRLEALRPIKVLRLLNSRPIKPDRDNFWVGLMDMQTYGTLDETDRRFDGNRARTHLMTNLGRI